MYKVLGLAVVPASLSFTLMRVYAEEKKLEDSLKVDELSLYSIPTFKHKYVEEEPSKLEENISWFRQSAEPYTAKCQEVYTKAKPKLQNVAELGKESYEFLNSPPQGFYPRLGVIGFAGIAGLFFARGSRIKKVVYPLGLMAFGASLYYPQQAAAFAKGTGSAVYDWSLQAYVAVESYLKDSTSRKKPAKKHSTKNEEVSEKSSSSISATEETSEAEKSSSSSS
ncbi:apolipoprotein O, a [Latimeria chalumnae]|uniref:MICOS complex subunit n=1 Tax=Latimeria chalumnae TaxID=7897 RepID=H3A753_LATCH|nr:PREDICTED: MICOS complex subunit MIC26 [Latimeria chalumnae]|eukprot:XP_006011766.1 PREDICTED: MICOS complex subunit MIC26 [Latimeria chalumnae]